jgi:hypothetical protein
MKRILVALSIVIALAACAGHGSSQNDEALQKLMQRKLKAAQRVLEGIALGNFDRISEQAQELIVISKEAEWRVLKTPKYELFSNDFRQTAGTIVDKARERNLDGATLAYMDLTMICVKCHKHVREVRMSRLERHTTDGGR